MSNTDARIDYARDSLAEIAMGEEHRRYAEVLILLEHWVGAHVAGGHGTVDAAALRDVLRDVFDYAEEGRGPAWFGAAVKRWGARGDGERPCCPRGRRCGSSRPRASSSARRGG